MGLPVKRSKNKSKAESSAVGPQREWGRPVELCVKKLLEKEYGQPFESKRLSLGSGLEKQFDAVSEDGTVVAMVKAFKVPYSDSTQQQLKTRFERCLVDCVYLSAVPKAKHRLFYVSGDYLLPFKSQIEILFKGKVAVRSI